MDEVHKARLAVHELVLRVLIVEFRARQPEALAETAKALRAQAKESVSPAAAAEIRRWADLMAP